ncbi:MAG: MerR family transcriptional regulator [Alphaproteobacteria bacterium]|nr:MerR family transcriptional regulator [Alphaproteobacteria bacterium]MBL6936399.1 MerR family transcriptional regulator [Alphaproteobacteria bacterium]MBL7098550.1 MerR family transcriptional regulator [Alphaproteobacteria bacterium]
MTADRHLSPAETARLLGVSVKALRLYEQHRLVTPHRTAAGWRVYGPAELAALHQVIALKRLGFPLARIAALTAGKAVRLDAVLAAQEQALARDAGRTAEALALVRAARARLQRHEPLTVDDLAKLTTETTMTTKATPEEMKAIFDPLIAKHYTQEDLVGLKARETTFDQAEVTRIWDGLFAEAKDLSAKGDPASPAALDLARRWSEMVKAFTKGDPGLAQKAGALWKEAVSDPNTAPRLPVDASVWAFVGKAIEALKAQGG